MSSALVFDTPETINGFRLLTLRSALRLEIAGMRHSSGIRASVTVRGILIQAGKAAPRNLSALSDAYAMHLRELGILAPVTPTA